jgi:alanine dehydrogenase
MIIGVPKEIKIKEFRVALTPAGAEELVKKGHKVLIEKSAGEGSGFSDSEYEETGAKIVSVEEAWKADMVIKVKEPLKQEYGHFRPGLVLFTYLHLSGVDITLTEELVKKQVTGIAYETVEAKNGSLPLLAPMSQIAGKVAVEAGAHFLAKPNGGRGVLLDNITGVENAYVVVVGAGIVGAAAATTAIARGAHVCVLDLNVEKLARLEDSIKGNFTTLVSNVHRIKEAAKKADLLIGAVLIAGAAAPKIVTEDKVKSMKPGSVIVDVAIDQGGCVDTIKPTTHENPTFVKHGVIHYAVTNMPGAYPRTSTLALTNATLPYAIRLAEGFETAISKDKGLVKGINTYKGYITYEAVAKDLKMMDKFRPFEKIQ